MTHLFNTSSRLLALFIACGHIACNAVSEGRDDEENEDTASDTSTIPDLDAGDTNTDTSTEDSGPENELTSEPIVPECTDCPGVGNSLEHMLCAIDLCDEDVVLDQEYTSPTVPNKTDTTRAAVVRFGDPTNHLAPLLNDSYTLMATGPASGVLHDNALGGLLGGKSVPDPFDKQHPTYDVMEWRLHLKAPAEADGFQIHYVFFSEEYDEYVGSQYNDKFYVFIEAASTNDFTRTVINFTACRNPNGYHDFVCTAEQAERNICVEGEKYCYIAINTALSECCWYGGCPQGTWSTNISGTGFVCAASELADSSSRGSSTGWLVTEWPIEPGEEFDIIFHIHDTSDGQLDSEVILDKFLFVKNVQAGTAPVK